MVLVVSVALGACTQLDGISFGKRFTKMSEATNWLKPETRTALSEKIKKVITPDADVTRSYPRGIDSMPSSELVNMDVGYELISKTLCAETDTDIMRLLIPQFSSKSDIDYCNANDTIVRQVSEYATRFRCFQPDSVDLYINEIGTRLDWKDARYEDFALLGYYKIAFNNETIVSIVFIVMWNARTAAHPNHDSFSININLTTGELIDIRSRYDFNDEFVELFYEKFKDWNLRSWQDVLVELDYFDSRLKKQLSADSNTSYYLTEDKLGMILTGFPFAIGNYCPIEIPYEAIERFKTE